MPPLIIRREDERDRIDTIEFFKRWLNLDATTCFKGP